MRLFILISVPITLLIIAIQNRRLIELVFFGNNTLSLPMFIWIIVFFLAGIMTSIILYVLNNLFQPTPVKLNSRRYPYPSATKASYQAKSKNSQTSNPPPSKSKTNSQSLENERENQDYPPEEFIRQSQSSPDKSDKPDEEMPPKSNQIPRDFDDDWETPRKPQQTPDDFDDWETPRKPEEIPQDRDSDSDDIFPRALEKTPRKPQIYSYNNRTSQNTGVGKKESVYDANYRVITPPYRGSQSQDLEDDEYEDDDEDWI